MQDVNKLDVYYCDDKVGVLAQDDSYRVAFQYDLDWIVNGFSISPFTLPLSDRVFIPNIDPFEGLFGVFADNLPDGWGRLLVDRMLKEKGINPFEISSLYRLAIVGESGMGALSYRPQLEQIGAPQYTSLDELCSSCRAILNSEPSDDLDLLFDLGGSSGGDKPKILTTVDNEEWIIKFPSSYDSENIGQQEFDYMTCASKCGLHVPEFRLFPSVYTSGYFGVKRFDRAGSKRIHMVTASCLLETSHRLPNLDYNDLMKLTMILTDDYDEAKQMFKLMCFNVFAHNRDDHSNNFSFIYDDSLNKWQVSPVYDLTYSSSLGGEHATTVNGNGSNPGIKEIMAVGRNIGLNEEYCLSTAQMIQKQVYSDLGNYLGL